jgi:hypothetical protein
MTRPGPLPAGLSKPSRGGCKALLSITFPKLGRQRSPRDLPPVTWLKLKKKKQTSQINFHRTASADT